MFSKIKLPEKTYDYQIVIGGDRNLQSFIIDFIRPVDNDVAEDILSLSVGGSGIIVNDKRRAKELWRKKFSYVGKGDFLVTCEGYNSLELAETLCVHLKDKHNLIASKKKVVWENGYEQISVENFLS